jgi:hypothetical protein
MQRLALVCSGGGLLWCLFVIGWYLFGPLVPDPHGALQGMAAQGVDALVLVAISVVLVLQGSIVFATALVVHHILVAEFLVSASTLLFGLLCFVGIVDGGLLLLPSVLLDLITTGIVLVTARLFAPPIT